MPKGCPRACRRASALTPAPLETRDPPPGGGTGPSGSFLPLRMDMESWRELGCKDIEGCSEDCYFCKKIDDTANDQSWCFAWIEELRDTEKVGEDVEHDYQVRLCADPPDAQISHIRAKLGNLQLKMPCWSLIDEVKEHAVSLALRESRELVKEKFRNAKLFQGCECARCDCNLQAGERLESMKQLVTKNLTKFVKVHVLRILRTLYQTIHKAEIDLVKSSADMASAKTWLRELYMPRPDQSKNANKSDGSDPVKLKIFGPVGERPLHVCSLSAYRFNDIQFEKGANYVKDGIIQGMRTFVESKIEGWEDIMVPYGKDYCAALGSYLANKGSLWTAKTGKTGEPAPPFWQKLTKWHYAHTREERCHQIAPKSDRQRKDMLKMVTVGIYEGETILLPMIAARDRETVHWMLNFSNQAIGKNRKKATFAFGGLFFRPMHRRQLTTFSVLKGWQYYANLQFKDQNVEASSRKSYFGLNILSFAASQGNTDVFDLIYEEVESLVINSLTNDSVNDEHLGWIKDMHHKKLEQMVRRAILDCQDEYGNTLLHLAAWNNKPAMYDRLIQMGAEDNVKNDDGLNSFTLCARYGVWTMFNHIWDKHMTNIVWRFGNVEKVVVDNTCFDWKGVVNFESRGQALYALKVMISCFNELKDSDVSNKLKDSEVRKTRSWLMDCSDSPDFVEKRKIVFDIAERWKEKERLSQIKKATHRILHSDEILHPDTNGQDVSKNFKDTMSAVRLITLFRPADWYEATNGKVEDVIVRKWKQGYFLVHVGQNVIPYVVILIIFGLMWLYRDLNVLEHNLWWASLRAASLIRASNPDAQILTNPVRANVSELKLSMKRSIFGTSLQSFNIANRLSDPESSCGWSSLRNSYSGALQACLFLYGVPSLLRLAYTQRRIRPSDLDASEDFKISFDEVVNFIYLNLESLLHITMCGLFVAIIAARVSAGSECAVGHVRAEKNATAVACIFLFLNLFISFKPFKGIGLLILTIYRFLVSEVFNFLLMYSIFFTAFLISIQTLHNANHVYLAWMGYTQGIFPQVQLLSQNQAYMQGANIPADATHLYQTKLALNGCDSVTKTIYDTAFELLDISFGDGLADALEDGRRQDYECAGYNTEALVGYIIVFWVFLTNVLVLNMLIAMMNSTFEEQEKKVHSVWLLDVSYRIMRYEKLFPELIRRLSTPMKKHSMRSFEYWRSALGDIFLVLYCCPEFHLWGCSRFIWSQCSNFLTSMFRSKNNLQKKLKGIVTGIVTSIALFETEPASDRDPDGKDVLFYPSRKVRGALNRYRTADLPLKIISFAQHICVESQVERWFKQLLKQQEGHEDDEKLIVLISLIFQLDLVINNFQKSLSTAKVRPQEN